jgi:tRNA uridine 5-carboxymethylaminomethyl modification enzyme
LQVKQDGLVRSALKLLQLPAIDIPTLNTIWPELAELRPDVVQQLEIEAQYAGYLSRQSIDIHAFRKEEALSLPDTLRFDRIKGLSREVLARLLESRPQTLGAASRLPGMTPAALALLYRHAKQVQTL